MKKVVYNSIHGGFSLSRAAALWLAARGLEEATSYLSQTSDWNEPFYPGTLKRHSSLLVECVETLGSELASGDSADLTILEVEDLYRIDAKWGLETVVTPDKLPSWTSAASDPEIDPDGDKYRADAR